MCSQMDAPICLSSLVPGREVAPEMPAHEAIDEIGDPVDDEEPGEEEVPAAPRGEIAMAGQRHRPGKASDLIVAVRHVGDAEYSGRVDAPAGDGRHANHLFAMLHRPHGHHRIVEAGFRSEIEGRVGIEDLQPAHQQHEQGDDVHPMGDAHRAGMAVDDFALFLRAIRVRHLHPPHHLHPGKVTVDRSSWMHDAGQ